MRGWIPGAVALALAAGVASSCSEEAPAIDRVQIAGNLFSAQVRQGVGPISIEVTGRGLQYVESAFLEDLPVTLRVGQPDGGVTVDLVIPHGTQPGRRGLTLNLAENRPVLTHAGAVEVTTIRATADGDDTFGRGTPEHPFRSLTKALGLAAGGDQVELGPGVYGLSGGERWPTTNNPGSPPTFAANNVPDNVVLKGAGSAVTALDGTGLLARGAALAFEGGAAVEGMTLRNFYWGLVVGRGVVNASDLSINTCQAEGAIAFGGATLRLASATVSGCATAGVRALGSATVEIGSSNITGNGVGVQYDGSSKGQILNSGISGNTGAGVAVAALGTDITLDAVTVDQNGQAAAATSSGVLITGTTRLTLRAGTLSRNQGSGLTALAGVHNLTNMAVAANGLDGLTLDGAQQVLVDRTQLSQNGRDGVRVTAARGTILDVIASTVRTNVANGVNVGAGTTTVRSSTIDGNGIHGIRVSGSAALSLPWDPASDPQATTIAVPQIVNACLRDDRVASAASAISVVHATLQGAIVPSGLVAGPVDASPQYRILNSGNQISFLQ